MLGESRTKQIADATLARSTADQTEVVILASDSALTRFANSTIHQNVAETDAEVGIRVVLGTRVGVAKTNNLDDEALAKALENPADIALRTVLPVFSSSRIRSKTSTLASTAIPIVRMKPALWE